MEDLEWGRLFSTHFRCFLHGCGLYGKYGRGRMEKLFAVCTPGLEPVAAQELHQLGLMGGDSSPRSETFPTESGASYEPGGYGSGGVEFQGSLHDVYRANLYLRTASRVLVRLGQFYAAEFPELRRKASRLLWENYLAPGRPIALRVTCQKSRLYHETAVAERVAGAIEDRLGKPSPVHKYQEDSGMDLPQLIGVRLVDNLCTISIDSSGALLHRRGYRLATARAPLRETLASAMVMASGWNKIFPLLDPFCGSGTIPIEAALLAGRVPAGFRRGFAFMVWPHFDSKFWKELLADAGKAIVSDIPKIIGSDRDAGAVRGAQANAERAGVAGCIEFSRRAISAIDPPAGPGWVVTNPPYGVRVSQTKDLRNLYAQFGKVMRAKCPGWRVTMVCDKVQLIRNTGLDFNQGIQTMNGGLKVKMVRSLVKTPLTS
jgi:putative N6-adenine-specific DNA methylase